MTAVEAPGGAFGDARVPQPSDVCAGLVTYGERSALWCPVVDVLLARGLQVIVVDNGAGPVSAGLLRRRAARGDIHVRRMGRNTGTAAAFGALLEIAGSVGGPFLWILDDDVVPAYDAVDRLLDAWTALGGGHRPSTLALVANRTGRGGYFGHLTRGAGASQAFPHPSSFLNVDVLRSVRRAAARWSSPRRACNLVPMPYGPYGGLFMHQALYRTITPRRELVLYEDDAELTFRMTCAGVDLVMVRDAELMDADPSWSSARGSAFFRTLLTNAGPQAHYAVRNRAWFESAYYGRRGLRRGVNEIVVRSALLASCRSVDDMRELRRLSQRMRDGAAGRLGVLPGSELGEERVR